MSMRAPHRHTARHIVSAPVAMRAALLGALVGGCAPDRGCSTAGRAGRVEYQTRYNGPAGTFSYLAARLALGGSMRSRAISSSTAYGSTVSSNPSIASVSSVRFIQQCCVETGIGSFDCREMPPADCAQRRGGVYAIWEEFDVTTLGPGVVDLVTHATDGTTIDSISLRVDPVASVSVERYVVADGGSFVPAPNGSEILLSVGQRWFGRVQLLADGGTPLHADHEIALTFSMPGVAQVVQGATTDGGVLQLGAGELFGIAAQASGQTAMVIVFRDLQRTSQVRVP